MTQPNPIVRVPRPDVEPVPLSPQQLGDLRIGHLRALRGPNPWYLGPAILCELHVGALGHATPAQAPGFLDRLFAALPELRDEFGDAVGAGASLLPQRSLGALLSQLVHRVGIAIQERAGTPVSFGRVIPGDDGHWTVLVAYEEEELGRRAVEAAVALVSDALVGVHVAAEPIVDELRALRERITFGPSTRALVAEARRRGIPVRRLNDMSRVQLGSGRRLTRLEAGVTSRTSSLAVEIAQDKAETKRMLEGVGLPTPGGEVVRTVVEALEAAERLGWPVLLKPVDGNHGRGVSGALHEADTLRDAWPLAQAVSRDVIIERFVGGRDFRVLVVAGRMVACAERVPAHVVGDGRRTVRELVEEVNADPLRGPGHSRQLTWLPIDEETEEHLSRQGQWLDAVPHPGEVVTLRATANLSTGGTAIDRTEEVHPDVIAACELAAQVIGLDVAGIDLLTSDVSLPLPETGGAIVEVNAGPGLRMHMHPTIGTARDVCGPIIDTLYPPGTPARIPIVAITGTNGKTTTTRLIAHLIAQSGQSVGFTTTDGVYVRDQLVSAGDMTGPFAANLVLSNPTVDVAVLETARGGILRAGLGFDECDVGVVLNVSADHLGLRGVHTLEQLAEVKAVVPAVVKRGGYTVLNADDPLVLAMRGRTVGTVALFSTAERNELLDEHVAAGGIGARVERGTLVIRRGRQHIPLLPIRDVPLTLGGAARFQVENVLAAVLAAHLQGVPREMLRAGLVTFFPSPALTPGRMNLLEVGEARLLVDYAHNPAAVAALVDSVQRLPARRRVAVIAAPGDRRDEDIRTVGELCAGFDHVIIREDEDLRGRAPGEIAALLTQGLRAGGLADVKIEGPYDEPTAIVKAVEQLGDRDVGVALVEDVPAVLAQIERVARHPTARERGDEPPPANAVP